jgi:carbon storage regulator
MLVLSRRVGEEIVIGSNIRVTVQGIKGQRVRVGITAPPSVPVFRLELLPECSLAGAAKRRQERPRNPPQFPLQKQGASSEV